MLRHYLSGTAAGTTVRRLRSVAQLGQARSQDFEQRLVWILGSPRSGSTWLFNLLAQHEAVVPIDEPLIGWYLGPFLCDSPGGNATTLSADNFSLRLVQAEKYSQFFAEQFSDVWAPGLARLIRERFFAHALRHATTVPVRQRIVVIKEPNGSQSADIISRVLPRGRILFLLRDGRDVVDSELAANGPRAWATREFPGLGGVTDADRLQFVIQSAHKWLWRTEMVQRAIGSHPGPTLVARYEDLLADPLTGLRRLVQWLELDVTEADLRRWIESQSIEKVDPAARGPLEFYRAASPGAWRENLRRDEQAALTAVLGDKLRELGYDAGG